MTSTTCCTVNKCERICNLWELLLEKLEDLRLMKNRGLAVMNGQLMRNTPSPRTGMCFCCSFDNELMNALGIVEYQVKSVC